MLGGTASQRYRIRTVTSLGGYVAINGAAISGAFDDLSGPGKWGFALAVAAPVAAHIWATLMLMAESDEFIRALFAKRFIIASGFTMAIYTAWGFMESYAGVLHAPGWLVYGLFWALYAAVSPFVRTSR